MQSENSFGRSQVRGSGPYLSLQAKRPVACRTIVQGHACTLYDHTGMARIAFRQGRAFLNSKPDQVRPVQTGGESNFLADQEFTQDIGVIAGTHRSLDSEAGRGAIVTRQSRGRSRALRDLMR